MKPALSILIILLSFLWQGCIHTYPDSHAIDPTKIEIAVDLSFNLKWDQLLSYYPPTKATSGIHRFIIEVFDKGISQSRHEHTISQEEFEEGFLRIPINATLNPIKYTVCVWCDLADSETSEPIAFDAKSLLSVNPLFPHGQHTLLDGCGFSTTEIDLTQYGNKIATKLIIPIELTPPAARFQFTATDVESFLKYADSAIQKGEKYSVTLSYDNSFPTTFNAFIGEPTGYYNSVEISFPLPALFSKQITICSDWVFAQESTEEISVTLTIFNSARMIISRIRNIKFPVERGKITTIKGDFLTNFYSNNITVDNIWDEEIIVNID